MKKKAIGTPPPFWGKIEQKLKQDPRIKPEVKEILNRSDGMVFESSPPPDAPNAVAYVSSEDANEAGKLEHIHFYAENMKKLPKGSVDDVVEQVADVVIDDDEKLAEEVGGILAHEGGHIIDFNPNDPNNPFPRGESIAESEEKLFHQQKVAKLIDFLSKNNLKEELDILKNIIE